MRLRIPRCLVAAAIAGVASGGGIAAPLVAARADGAHPRLVARRPTAPASGRAPAQRARGGAFAAGTLRARAMLALYLRQGLRQPYVAEQTSRLLEGQVRESRQIVKHAGPGRERIEYTAPAGLRGEVILVSGGRMLHYQASTGRILEGAAPVEEFQTRVREVLQGIRQGRVLVRVIGSQLVAGQTAAIVEIRAASGGPFRRFWVDTRTGVRLRHETLDAAGSVLSTTYVTTIDYNPTFDPSEFRADSLPAVRHEPLLPSSPSLGTVQAAQALVAYPIRQPVVPLGFTLTGVWAVGAPAKRTTILRYGDGVNVFALYEHPLPRANASLPLGPRRPLPRYRNGVAHWAAADRTYTLIGDLAPAAVRAVAESLR
jgi:outer membrane lipoprotein-sorting protein